MKYCISDVHGCSKTLAALLVTINATKNDTIYLLGDYVDRGPDSKGVLDIVMNIPNAVCHKGNHEDMLLKAALNPHDGQAHAHWIQNGGSACINSFHGTIDAKYIKFMRDLKLITELDDYYLCHAGITDDAMSSPEEVILWDRYCEVDPVNNGGRKLICGHTPTELEQIMIDIELGENKIIIDGGCVFNNSRGYGNLVALRLEDMKIFEQTNVDC